MSITSLRGPGTSAPLAAVAVALSLSVAAPAQEGFKRTDSRRPYSHHLELVDAQGKKFDPREAGAPPFSSFQTCRTCHDVGSIEHGWHFNAASADRSGRPGEPWIWTDERSGSQLPLSYRGWEGTWLPSEVGLEPMRFLQIFGRHMAGGARPYTGAALDEGRFRITGDLDIDCMMCHSGTRSWSHEKWAKTVADGDFAWASAVAMGVAKIEGTVRTLPDDLDPTSQDGAEQLPKITYDPSQVDLDGHVFFDVVRRPRNDACYACHSVHRVGENDAPRWLQDADVHLHAGMSCVDCHRNGIHHHTVRGYEGEDDPTGLSIGSLSCRGCHIDGDPFANGGRLGAPKPAHAGIPLIHFEKLTCTACHSGPVPGDRPDRVQTSMSHRLGIPDQLRQPDDLPVVVEPVFRRNADGKIEPTRMMWPSFWGYEKGDDITPIPPDQAFRVVRRAAGVRSRLRPDLRQIPPDETDLEMILGPGRAAVPEDEWTDEEREAIADRILLKTETEFFVRLTKALQDFQSSAPEGANAVAVSGGEVYRLDEEGTATKSGTHPRAEPYSWPLAHDVRPARMSLGARGCVECHSPDAPLIHGVVTAIGPAPDSTPRRATMMEIIGLDPTATAAWELSFVGRDLFKLVLIVTGAVIALLLLLHALFGLDAITRRLGGGHGEEAEER